MFASVLALAVASGACGDDPPTRDRGFDAEATDTDADSTDADGADADGADVDGADADVAVLDLGPERATRVRMDFTRPTFFAAPFPSEELRDSGRIDLSSFPNPGATPYVDTLVEVASASDGFATTATLYFALDGSLAPEGLPTPFESVEPGAAVFLARIADDGGLERTPVDVAFLDDGGPHGDRSLLAILPYQGFPLQPDADYVAVVGRALHDTSGAPLGAAPALGALAVGDIPEGLSGTAAAAYQEAWRAVLADGMAAAEVAGIAAFHTADPARELLELVPALPPTAAIRIADTPVLSEVYDRFCVFGGTVDVPVYQQGTPPFDGAGGAWAIGPDGLELQGTERARLWVTVPRSAAPESGFPTAVFVRTGGGGDRPLVDRGLRAVPGGPTEPGSGPAGNLADVGFVGVSVDGPHGGARNISGRDEQLLIFNFQNPVAMRDNIRQSALELALVPPFLDGLQLDLSGCPDAEASSVFDTERIALIGHSMGATIAPLVAAAQPRYRALVLSGAGGSWIENIIHKRSPVPVRPIAELILRYEAGSLHRYDPALALLQWAGEAADPPVYGRHVMPRDVLMFQGITDTYILPPMANALSLALGLDLGGESLEERDSESVVFTPLEPLLPLRGRARVELPVTSNHPSEPPRTAVVVQHLEGPIEDGHEVMFQTEGPQRQYRAFLESWARGAAVVPE